MGCGDLYITTFSEGMDKRNTAVARDRTFPFISVDELLIVNLDGKQKIILPSEANLCS